MPLYEYECGACGQRVEVIQKFSDLPPDACATCGKGPVTRLMSSPAIQFKGTGWYITDYAQKGKPGAQTTGAAETKNDGSSGGGDSAPASDASKKPASDAAKQSDSTPASTGTATKTPST